MKQIPLLLLIIVIMSGCAVTKGTDNKIVSKAMDMQAGIVADPLFTKILTELESEGKIDWSEGRADDVKNLKDYPSKIAWLLATYKSKGTYDKESVLLWRKWNPFSKTTAVTNTCEETTKLNKWRLKRDEFSLVNTLIHERVHSFCVVHPDGKQTRAENMCDASYVAGDLAEAIALYRAGVKERQMDKPICPALLKKIEEYKLLVVK